MALALCVNNINSQGRELVEHGTTSFPVACYHDDLRQDSVYWHWHDELEAFLISEGKALVSVGTEKFELREGEGIFINGGVLHGAWDVEDSGCRFHSVVFHPRLVGGSIDSVYWQNYVQPVLTNDALKYVRLDGSAAWHEDAKAAIETTWQACVSEHLGYEFQIRTALSQLVFLLSQYHPALQPHISEKKLRDGERIKIMLQYIHDHYAEDLSTAAIARQAMISDSECLRCFRSTIGVPPIQYVRQFRIQKASELLNGSTMKIADIGAQCGFQDISYFTKTFREMKGCTPSEYRLKSGKILPYL